MKLKANQIEIQYRECQILRDSAKSIHHVFYPTNLNLWIKNIQFLGETQKQKMEYCKSLIKFLRNMDIVMLTGLIEYIQTLIDQEKGIDIMIPFVSKNNILILPVNIHE